MTHVNEDIEELLSIGTDHIRKNTGHLCSGFHKQLRDTLISMIDDEVIYNRIELRIATLCAQTTAVWLNNEDPLSIDSRQMLHIIVESVEHNDIKSLLELSEMAEQLIHRAQVIGKDQKMFPTLNDKVGQESKYATITITQVIRLAQHELCWRHTTKDYLTFEPLTWMPSFWAAITCGGGLPRAHHNNKYQMHYFWRWYLSEAIPIALNLSHSLSDHRFVPPPDSPSHAEIRFARPLPSFKPRDPLTTRFSFFEGYLEKTVDQKERITSLKYMSRGESQILIEVDYRRRYGIWRDFYSVEKYRRGYVEGLILGEVAQTRAQIPISTWVIEKEAKLLRSISIHRLQWLVEWAQEHWNPPFDPQRHLDDIQHCFECYQWTLELNQISVEEAHPLIQLGWSLCALILNKQVANALNIFRQAWSQEHENFWYYKTEIKSLAGKSFSHTNLSS